MRRATDGCLMDYFVKIKFKGHCPLNRQYLFIQFCEKPEEIRRPFRKSVQKFWAQKQRRWKFQNPPEPYLFLCRHETKLKEIEQAEEVGGR